MAIPPSAYYSVWSRPPMDKNSMFSSNAADTFHGHLCYKITDRTALLNDGPLLVFLLLHKLSITVEKEEEYDHWQQDSDQLTWSN